MISAVLSEAVVEEVLGAAAGGGDGNLPFSGRGSLWTSASSATSSAGRGGGLLQGWAEGIGTLAVAI